MQSVNIGGKAHALGKRIGKGGEGEVYTLESVPDGAVKIYKESLRGRREPKVRAMINGALSATTDLVAFPAQIVTDLKGSFTGFMMRLVTGYQPMHELYSPKSRKLHYPKADFRFLIRAALNVARAVGKVHQTGCVIGDFNHSGVLVARDATVALIDADSFQFTINGRSYPCVVGVPDFTPPELHGVDLPTLTRTKAHDHFGLGVAIFQLLAMGKHPYAGRFAGADLTMSEAIAQNRFAFSLSRSAETRTTPPPGSITLKDLPAPIAQAFEAAFGLSPAARPDAATWVSLLKDLEAGLSHCATIKSHYYPSAAGKCVWCRLAVQTGVDMFPDLLGGDIPTPPGGPFDVERIWAQVRAVSLPRPDDLLPKWTGTLGAHSTAVAEAKRALVGRKVIGLVALVAAAMGFVVAAPLAVVWLGLGGFGLFKLFGGTVETEPFKKACADADQRARVTEVAFLQRIGLIEVHGVRDDLDNWIAAYRQLDADLNRELARLKSTRESRQRDTFLDNFPIRRAKIAGIGPAKTATLASFGIETATDINANAVLAVPGFGEAMTAKLIAWRRGHEAKFRYNSAPDPSDIQAENAVRSASAAKRADLQSKIRSGLAALQSGPQRLVARAQNVDHPLMHALGERAKAAHNLKLLGLPVPTGTPITIAQKPSPATAPPAPTHTAATSSNSPLSCPRCGSPMLRRTARRGRHSGREFWGCSRYPSCTATRN
jgi:DNA-binding helix-hairpin-helix protein with protein kinase domain